MKTRVSVMLGVTLILSLGAAQGEWRMRVHQGASVTEFPVADIDSLSFYEDGMVAVPSGVFVMGDGQAYCGLDEHQVTLTRDFYLGQHEVTNQEYLQALQWAYDQGYVTATITEIRDNLDGSTEDLLEINDYTEILFDGAGSFYLRESPSSYTQNAYPDGYDPANHPVKKVTWYGAVRYCDWLSLQAGLPRAYDVIEDPGLVDWVCNGGDPHGAVGYRLPTDAEWEYAAQFNDERIFPWGSGAADCDRANFYPGGTAVSGDDPSESPGREYCVGWSCPVGSYPNAPEALGLADMAGNVFEWCNDWHACDLGTEPVTDPTGPGSGGWRVLNGGCWFHNSRPLECAGRYYYHPHNSNNDIGFRTARTVSP